MSKGQFEVRYIVYSGDDSKIKTIKKDDLKDAMDVAIEASQTHNKATLVTPLEFIQFKGGEISNRKKIENKEIPDVKRENIQAIEEEDGLTFQWLKFTNSPTIKRLGGMYANRCVETDTFKFYKSEYLRDRAYPKFVRDCAKAYKESK